MPEFQPHLPLRTLSQCDQVAAKAIWRVCRVGLVPMLPAFIFSCIFAMRAWREGVSLIWLLCLVCLAGMGYISFWYTGNPKNMLRILSSQELEDQSRSRSFGENKVNTNEKILVVGAGFAGMAVSASLIRRGIAFDLVDSQDDIGGLWYTGGYENVHILSSKLITEYKDVPMPKDYPENPSQTLMLEYFRKYVDRWRIRDFASFDTYVKKVVPTDKEGHSYSIEFESTSDRGMTGTKEYKGVVACVGHHRLQKEIHKSFPGNFTGEILHSNEYKKREQLKGKRVLVVGGGNSAMDIAVEAALHAESSHNSMRTGRWIVPRFLFGMPSLEVTPPWWPHWFMRLFHEFIIILFHGFYGRYNIPFPKHRYGYFHPTVSTSFMENILFGDIKPHPNIKSFNGKDVTFADGTVASIDLIIYCTGYNLMFPLLDEVITYEKGVPQLIQAVGVPGKRNFFCCGVHQPRYGAGPLLSRGAELIAEGIEIQNLMDQPVLDYIAKIFYYIESPFYKPPNVPKDKEVPTDLITCPFSLTKRIQLGRAMLPLLPRLSRWFPMRGLDHVLTGTGTSAKGR